MVAVSVPLFVTGIMIAAFVGIQPKVMGFKISKPHKQLVIALLGLPLGFAEFYLIQPDLTKISITPKEIITWVITLIICVGLLEEFLFRGILFNVAYKSLSNNKAIYFTSLLYAAMTISSKSLLNVINALLISILFCRLLIRSKSIIGISLAHGIINITYYLICPHIF
jgi:membrane protease YdiL (CAAX protease family)